MFYCFIYLGLWAESIRMSFRILLGNFLWLSWPLWMRYFLFHVLIIAFRWQGSWFCYNDFPYIFSWNLSIIQISTCFTDNNIVTKYYLSFQYSYFLFISIFTVLCVPVQFLDSRGEYVHFCVVWPLALMEILIFYI